MDKLRSLDTTGVEPTSHAVPLRNVMRDDEPRPSFPRDDMLANAPDRAGDFFRVPRIIEE
jgi:aspartyl-tRNA(Asn)/glutamyl-tRNA(Gln) amidotransferase subunit C